MSSSFKNIILILAFAIMLPVSVFIVVEIGSLSENEEMLEQVYLEQLDAIIFSINQYSADLFEFYFKQIDFQWSQSRNQSLIDSTFIQQNLAIEAIGIKQGSEISSINLATSSVGLPLLDSLFTANEPLLERLTRYKETGYMKPELIGQVKNQGTMLNVTLIIIGESTPCMIFINPTLFVEDLLAPKIQQIAQQDLDIAVRQAETFHYIYGEELTSSSIIKKGELTLLDGLEIFVSLKDQSLESAIQSRTQRNIFILGLMIVLVLIGIILVFRNFKKEMILSKAKADFVANVSHEIRTPLALISMFNETLLLGRVKDESRKKEYLEIISKETARLNNIVNKILSFSQIDASKKKYNFQPIAPDDIVREVMDTYSYHLKEKGVSHELILGSNATVLAERESIIEVVINLIDNAIKYSKDRKEITIKSYNSQEHYFLEVSDKGMGISKKDQERVFEKFFRAEGGDIHNTKGTGLGLSLISEIMKAHGGSIELTSKLGQGSTFKLKFPIQHG